MNKYLARLKAASPTEKPSIPPSVTSGTEGPGSFPKMLGACGTFGTAPGGPAEKHASGEFWPWAPYIGADDVARFRADLVCIIERLADLEGWPDEQRDDVLARAVRGPLADLLPNLHHFNGRMADATAKQVHTDALNRRNWRFDR